jgi:methenyltetrahydromethanopterin cyclohydrolase
MNLNQDSAKIAREMMERAQELKIGSLGMDNGTTLIDCGVDHEGSMEAGVMFSKICMGAQAEIGIGRGEYDGMEMDVVKVMTEHPAVACLASQKAGWNITGEKFFSLGSGPARVLARKPKETYEKIGYSERSDVAVICLEAAKYPPVEVCDNIARSCGVSPDNLYVLIARTAALTSSVQISARMVETALFRLDHLGFDTRRIERGEGTAPVAPIVGDDNKMMGVTNDMVIYGGEVKLEVQGNVDVENIPSNNSEAYGKPFGEIFKEAGYDFYKINPAIDITTGDVRRAGSVDPPVLKRSLGV